MLAHLAYKANRSYVFRDYSWNLDHIPWSKEQLRKVYHGQHPTTPANALLAGPAVGGMWPPGDPAPRSVSTEWFNIVCPPERRRKITTEAIKAPIRWEKGDVHFRTWLKVLAEAPEECIEIIGSSEDSFPQLFDVYVWGSDRVLPLWEDFRDSPVSQLQRPSHIVTSAVEKNKPLFLPRGPKPKDIVSIDPFDRMLAIHIRRGDYKNACVHFGTWNVSFYGWNQLPYLSDRFQHPAGWTWGKNTPENMDIFMKQCYPDDDFILKKIRAAKWDYEQAAKAGEKRLLDVLFLMTNEKAEWQAKITKMLRAEGWGTVVTTKDLRLDSEQHEVGMVVDMELARKAAVFIGNGVSIFVSLFHYPFAQCSAQWSSFTSSITHRRLVDKREYYANRFF